MQLMRNRLDVVVMMASTLLLMVLLGSCDQMAASPDPAAAAELACLPDCSGADLRDADLAGANLREANLSEASLSGADLSNTDLDGANLRGADLRGVRMLSTVLRGADLSGADLVGANLNNANLSGAILRGADLTRVNLRDATMAGVDLTGATLTDADLRRADMRGADLTAVQGCDVSGRLPGCPAIGEMVWSFLDACDDGSGIELRFFDLTNDLVWPSDDEVYVLDRTEIFSFPLACRAGAKVCYGADDGLGIDWWGVGIDGDEDCEDCCYTCPAGGATVDLGPIALTCS